MSFEAIVFLVSGSWLTGMSMLMEVTGNKFLASVIFKVIPFFIGLACFVGFFHSMRWMQF